MLDELTIDLNVLPMINLIKEVQRAFPGVPYHVRDHIGFKPEYVEWIRKGTKTCTIRFRQNEIDIPSAAVLPIRETTPDDPSWRVELGDIYIRKLAIKRFDRLTHEDCVWDGFKKPEELHRALEKVYGKIRDDQFVSLYWFEIKSWATSRI